MKRTLNLAILMLLILAYSFGQDNNYIDSSLCRKNKIKSVKVYEYKYRNEKVRGRGRKLFYRIYDTTGLLSESYFYGRFPVGTVHDLYTYDTHGNRIAQVDKYTMRTLYKYDDKNRIVEKEIPNFGGKWYYTYDSIGNQASIKWYWFGETRPNAYFLDRFEYNDNNRMTKMIRYKADKSIHFYMTYEYDAMGNRIKEIRFANSEATDIRIYEYDQNGNCIENKTLEPNEMIAWYKISYDHKGLIINQIGKLSSEDKPYCRKYIYEYYD